MSPTGRLRLLGVLVAGGLAAGLAVAAVSGPVPHAPTQPPRPKPPPRVPGIDAGFQPPRFLLVNATTVKLRGWIRNDTSSSQNGDCNVVLQTGTSPGLVQSGINFRSPKLAPGQSSHFVETFGGDVAKWVASRASGSRYPKTAAINAGTTVYCGILQSQAPQEGWGRAHPGVPEPPFTYLQHVSCSGPSACLAIGERQQAGHSAWLAERWDGRSWRTVYATSPSTPMRLVSCPTATWCLIAGAGMHIGAVLSHWLAVWRPAGVTVLGSPAVGRASLASMSCIAPNDCFVAGFRMLPRSSPLLLARFDGTAFTPMPEHLNPNTQVASVSCASADSCMLVGPPTSEGSTFAARWDGKAWAAVPTPTLPFPKCFGDDVCRGLPMIDAVWCGSSGCLALGSPKLAYWWNGSSWAKVSVPGDRTWLVSASCVQGGCLAVGYRVGSRESPAAYWWNGTSWRDVSPQIPRGWPLGAALSDVWCGSGPTCVGIGSVVAYPVSGPNAFELSARWIAHRWSTMVVRQPGGPAA